MPYFRIPNSFFTKEISQFIIVTRLYSSRFSTFSPWIPKNYCQENIQILTFGHSRDKIDPEFQNTYAWKAIDKALSAAGPCAKPRSPFPNPSTAQVAAPATWFAATSHSTPLPPGLSGPPSLWFHPSALEGSAARSRPRVLSSTSATPTKKAMPLCSVALDGSPWASRPGWGGR